MPWRKRYIAPRRNPLALSAYAMTLLMGVFFLFGLFDSSVINEAIGQGWQIAWQWLLTVGGVAGLGGCIVPYRRIELALNLEWVGSFACCCGLLVYSVAIILVAGWGAPVWLLLAVLALGFGARTIQTRNDLHRLERIVQEVTDAL